MWIIVMGGDSTGKRATVDYLTKNEKFEYLGLESASSSSGSPIGREMALGSKYLATHLNAQELTRNKDVVTVRSFWEWGEIFPPIMVRCGELSEEDASVIKNFSDSIKMLLKPPTAVIYMKPSKKMSMYDRALLNGKTPDDERLSLLLEAYERFVEKIKIPVIEIDASEPIDRMKASLEFGLASLRSSKLNAESIWKRDMFFN